MTKNPNDNPVDCDQSLKGQPDNSSVPPAWVGRFAPSPTGPLHLGSLVAAVASYMIAKQKGGKWLVRIEDLDPPREVSGSSKSILTSLEDYGLYWDGDIVYQSQRDHIYQQRLNELIKKDKVYWCDCSRRVIRERSQGCYDGFCRQRKHNTRNGLAIRVKFENGFEAFTDNILGPCLFNSKEDKQDFIVIRKDQLFAYQLAVVADDIEQGVNHIVRGLDILDSTPRQNFLYHCFNHKPPHYYHVPLVKNKYGVKFSKRIGSSALTKDSASTFLLKAMGYLGQNVEPGMESASPEAIISHFTKDWKTSRVVATTRNGTI